MLAAGTPAAKEVHMLIIQRPTVEPLGRRSNRQRFDIAPLEPGFGHPHGGELVQTSRRSAPGVTRRRESKTAALRRSELPSVCPKPGSSGCDVEPLTVAFGLAPNGSTVGPLNDQHVNLPSPPASRRPACGYLE